MSIKPQKKQCLAPRLKVMFQHAQTNANGEVLRWILEHEDGLRAAKEKGLEALRAFWLPLARKESGHFSTEELQNAAKIAVWRLQEQIYYLQSLFNLEVVIVGTTPPPVETSGIVESKHSFMSLVQKQKLEEVLPTPSLDLQSFDWSINEGELGERAAS